MNIDVITFIINSIEEGYYIYLLVRRKEIKAYQFESEEGRERDRFAHDMLIYGYDINQQKFNIADNFIDGKYSFQQCTFQELALAIKNMDPKFESRLGFKGNIELIEFSKDKTSTFNLKRVLDSFNDYVLSKPTSLWNTMELRNTYGTKKWYFGLECYDYILQRVCNMNKDSIYIQDFHLMWEHKKHLRRIIAFLMEKNYIADKGAVLQIQSIEKNALIARNLVLKYSISGKESIKEDIVMIYSQMAIEEKELMISLIKNIEIAINK